MLTVKEMLLYTAELKRSTKESRAEKEAVVDEWISKLALDSCKDTRIGSNLQRGVSGGQVGRSMDYGVSFVAPLHGRFVAGFFCGAGLLLCALTQFLCVGAVLFSFVC